MRNPIIPRIYIDPHLIINKTSFLFNKYGLEEFIRRREFKKIREKYIAACYLIGIRSIDNLLYYISGENSEAPDVIAAYFKINENKKREEKILNIEVMTLVESDKRPISRAIIDKLSSKAYPKYFNLVCYVQKNKEINPFIIHKELSKLKFNIGEIFIIIETGENNEDYVACVVYPGFNLINVNMKKEIEKFKLMYPVSFIKTSFGAGTKEEDLGKAFYSYENINDEIDKI